MRERKKDTNLKGREVSGKIGLWFATLHWEKDKGNTNLLKMAE